MSDISVQGSGLNNSLTDLLLADDIQPGSDPSYQICKTIYTYHPLGGKMAAAPMKLSQSQDRKLTVQEAPAEIIEAFTKEWNALGADGHILNVTALSRVYGLASIVLGCEGVESDKPIDMTKIWDMPIFFNVLDPLNTAGSLVLNQVPTSADFNKPVRVTTNGETYHRSRFQVLMNEQPVYLEYTGSAFGFVGRSVYQRALFPLKSFIRSMIADDLIATKLALLIAIQKQPGSVLDNVMAKIAGIKRSLLKEAQTGNVLSIGIDEKIETLNMMNVDGAGKYSRDNILKNVATAADMPAFFLDNETMVEGFGEGTEDAKNIARYVEWVRKWAQPVYAWFDTVCQYRAWNPEFYKIIQKNYPEQYGAMSYEEAFSAWRADFTVAWPSLLIEPESELVKVDDVRLQAVIAAVQTLAPLLDPANKATLIDWAALNIGSNKLLFEHELGFDMEALAEFLEEQHTQQTEMVAAGMQAGEPGGSGDGEAKKMGKFDSVASLKAAVARLPAKKGKRPAKLDS